MGKTNGFSRCERVKRSEEIQKLFKEGWRFNTDGAKLFVLNNNLKQNRIAITLSRGYGNSVKRNMSKRLSREAYRNMKKNLKTGFDLLFLCFPGKDNFVMRIEQFNFLFKKAGLLQEM